MYENLLIGLRGHAKRCGCDDRCPCYDAKTRGYATCSEELAEKATDAIVELSRAVSVWAKRAMAWAEKAEEAHRWIPVTERMPEKRRWVLCRCVADIIEVLRWENNEWYHDPMHVYYPSFVTHWQKLPDSPKEDKPDVQSEI